MWLIKPLYVAWSRIGKRKKPRNWFQGIDSASLSSLAGRYVKYGCRTSPPGWESIPGLLKKIINYRLCSTCGSVKFRSLLLPGRITYEGMKENNRSWPPSSKFVPASAGQDSEKKESIKAAPILCTLWGDFVACKPFSVWPKQCSGSVESICFWASWIRILNYLYGSRSGSFYQQAKYLIKTLIFSV